MSIFLLPMFFASQPVQPAHACVAQGTPLVEIQQKSERRMPTTTTKIFASGAWTVELAGRTASGCFDRSELRAIRRAVQRAPWQTVQSPVACFAHDPNFTEYRVRGQLRFTERFCSGVTADVETLKAIDLVKAELAEDHAVPPPAPAPAPATPLFEIHKRSDLAEPGSNLAIYSNGRWTFQPIGKDGRLGAITTGHLDRHTIASLRTEIARAAWETTYSRIVCKAYSPSYTQYFVHGKLEYTARLCGAERLDALSLTTISHVEAALAHVMAPAPEPVPPPPADDCH